MKCNGCGSREIKVTTIKDGNNGVFAKIKECSHCGGQDISEDKPKLLTIELDSIDSVPRVFHNGEEITGKIHVKFEWHTKTDKPSWGSPVIEIEHAHAKTDEKAFIKSIGYNTTFNKE